MRYNILKLCFVLSTACMFAGNVSAQTITNATAPQTGDLNAEKIKSIKAELQNMPPEERQQRIQALRENIDKSRADKQNKFQEKWETATPDMKFKFCRKAKQNCDNGKAKACELVENECGR